MLWASWQRDQVDRTGIAGRMSGCPSVLLYITDSCGPSRQTLVGIGVRSAFLDADNVTLLGPWCLVWLCL